MTSTTPSGSGINSTEVPHNQVGRERLLALVALRIPAASFSRNRQASSSGKTSAASVSARFSRSTMAARERGSFAMSCRRAVRIRSRSRIPRRLHAVCARRAHASLDRTTPSRGSVGDWLEPVPVVDSLACRHNRSARDARSRDTLATSDSTCPITPPSVESGGLSRLSGDMWNGLRTPASSVDTSDERKFEPIHK